MKFLCVPCDKPMMLRETRGPFEGTMSIVYGCPTCGHSMAMLTNKMETQMVRSLGVNIGGKAQKAEPMATVRSSLKDQPAGGSKCPFTGVVAKAFDSDVLEWTEGARARVQRIPDFVRPMVMRNIEDYARQQGIATVNEAVVDAMKGQVGM